MECQGLRCQGCLVSFLGSYSRETGRDFTRDGTRHGKASQHIGVNDSMVCRRKLSCLERGENLVRHFLEGRKVTTTSDNFLERIGGSVADSLVG